MYIGGRSAPLLYSSDGQVNAILPLGITANTSTQVIVTRGNQYSVPVDIVIAPAAPGVFATAGNGQGQGFIYSGGKLANSASPAKAGDTLVMYASGLGSLDSAVDDGAAPPPRLIQTVDPVTVKIGGITALTTYAGVAPGLAAGLYQVNAIVPAGVTPGDQVPVLLSVAGHSSPAVTMSVR